LQGVKEQQKHSLTTHMLRTNKNERPTTNSKIRLQVTSNVTIKSPSLNHPFKTSSHRSV